MAATNFTPIQLYHSTTAAAVPVNTNLVNGELAINITDGKLYYKDNGGTVQVIATKATGTIGGSTTQVQYNLSGALAGSSNFVFDGTTATINTLNLTNALGATYGGTAQSSWTTGDLLYASGSNTLAKLGIGLNTYILTSNGSIPGWAAPSAISVNTATNLAGGAAGSVPYQSGAGATTFLSIGTANQVITSSGSAPQWSSGLSITTLTASDAVTFSATTQNIALGTSQTSGTFTAGGAAQTGTQTVGQSTKTHTLNIGTGATESGATKTINIGTGGVSTSTTAITIGSANGTTITVNGTVNASTLDLTNLEVMNIKAQDGTASMTLADTTGIITLSATAGTANGVLYLNGSRAVTSGSALTFDGTNLVNTAGYLGTTQSGAASSYFIAKNSVATSGVVFGAHSSGAGYIDVINNNPLFFAVNDIEQMRLTSTGLGIGTSSPQTGLSLIKYGSQWTNHTANPYPQPAGNTFLQMEAVAAQANWFGFTGSYGATSGSANLLLQVNLNNTSQQAGNYIASEAQSAIAADLTFGKMVAGATTGANSTKSEQMRLESNGTLILRQSSNAANTSVSFNTTVQNALTLDSDGDLGIGTASPTAKLQVAWSLDQLKFTVPSAGFKQIGSSYTGYVSGNDYSAIILGTDGSAGGKIQFSTMPSGGALTTAATIDQYGNLGLGVTPSALWDSAFRAIQVGSLTSLAYNNGFGQTHLLNNAIYTTSWVYQTSGVAAVRYDQRNGEHQWFRSTSAQVAGNDPVFSQAMTLDADGDLGIGETSPVGALHIKRSNGQLLLQNGTSAAEMRISAFNNAGNANAAIIFEGYANVYGRFDSSGNLGLGVTPKTDWSADYDAFQLGGGSSLSGHTSTSLNFTVLASNQYVNTAGTSKFINDGYAPRYLQRGDTGEHYWYTTNNGLANGNVVNTQAMTLDASGNLMLGGTSTTQLDGVFGQIIGSSSKTTAGIALETSAGAYMMYTDSSDALIFWDSGSNAERARITSGGYFKASNNGTYQNSTGAYHEMRTDGAAADWTATFTNTTATGANAYGLFVKYTASSPNGTGNEFLVLEDSSALRAEFRSNGGLANYQSNNVDLSDARTKTDINPLASYWNKIAALEIVTYKYKDQTHDDLNIGVIAQQVEQVAPEFVDADGFGETPEDGVPLKTIYNKDLTFAAIKALQEAMARIEQLEAKVAALEAK